MNAPAFRRRRPRSAETPRQGSCFPGYARPQADPGTGTVEALRLDAPTGAYVRIWERPLEAGEVPEGLR